MNFLLADHSDIKIIDAVKKQLIQYFLSKTLGKFCKYSTKNEGFLYLHSIEVIQMPISNWICDGTIESLSIPHYDTEISVSRLQNHEINSVDLQILVKNVELTLKPAPPQPKESLPEDSDLDILQDQIEYLVQHIYLSIENIHLIFDFDTTKIKFESESISIVPTIHEIYNIEINGSHIFVDSEKMLQCERISLAVFKERVQIESNLVQAFTSKLEIHKLFYLFHDKFHNSNKSNNRVLEVLFYIDHISLIYYLSPSELRPSLKFDFFDIMGSIDDVAIQKTEIYLDLSKIASITSKRPPKRLKQSIHELWQINSKIREPGIWIKQSKILIDDIDVLLQSEAIKSLIFTPRKWPNLPLNSSKNETDSDFLMSINTINFETILNEFSSRLEIKNVEYNSQKIILDTIQLYFGGNNERCVMNIRALEENCKINFHTNNTIPLVEISLPDVYLSTNKFDLQNLYDLAVYLHQLKLEAESLDESVFFAAKESLDIAEINLTISKVHFHFELPSSFVTNWFRIELDNLRCGLKIGKFVSLECLANSINFIDSDEQTFVRPFTDHIDIDRFLLSMQNDPTKINVQLSDNQFFIHQGRLIDLNLRDLLPAVDTNSQIKPNLSVTAHITSSLVSVDGIENPTIFHCQLDDVYFESFVHDNFKIFSSKIEFWIEDHIASMTHVDELTFKDLESYFNITKSVKIGVMDSLDIKVYPNESFEGLKIKSSDTNINFSFCPDSLRILADFFKALAKTFGKNEFVEEDLSNLCESTRSIPEKPPVDVLLDVLDNPIMSDGFSCFLAESGPLEIIPDYFNQILKSQSSMFTFCIFTQVNVNVDLYDGFDFDVSVSSDESFSKRSLSPLMSIKLLKTYFKLSKSKFSSDFKINCGCELFEIVDHLESSTWGKLCTSLKRGYSRNSIQLKLKRKSSPSLPQEYFFEVKIAPIKVNLDQDTLNFLLNFSILYSNLSFHDDSLSDSSEDNEVPYFGNLYLFR
eukprot:NODE_20_length_44879_cov_0.624654.p3 type:complete len:983 gc:universal NODE_20_length_44879_cov_0.624654:42603-39655(-)